MELCFWTFDECKSNLLFLFGSVLISTFYKGNKSVSLPAKCYTMLSPLIIFCVCCLLLDMQSTKGFFRAFSLPVAGNDFDESSESEPDQ